jgi:hypothetical protein
MRHSAGCCQAEIAVAPRYLSGVDHFEKGGQEVPEPICSEQFPSLPPLHKNCLHTARYRDRVQRSPLPQKEIITKERKQGITPIPALANPHNGTITQSLFLLVQSITMQFRYTLQCCPGLTGTSGPPVGSAQQIENRGYVWIQVHRFP